MLSLNQRFYHTFKQTGKAAVPNILRSILKKPYLAEYIRHLDFSILDRGHHISDIDTSFISETDSAWIRAQLPESVRGGMEYCDKWLHKIIRRKDN
jgi:hypothetical protein